MSRAPRAALPRRLAALAGAGAALALASACGRPPASPNMLSPADEDPYLQRSTETASVRLRPEVCRNVPDNQPDERRLDEGALVAFLERQGYQATVTRERPDLVYVDVRSGDQEPVRLHVAILDDANAAGENLHRALLGHGAGAWGVHRANLAVLSPTGTARQAVDFAGRTKLACWGVLTIATSDDDYVVPGGYMEF